MKKWYLLGLVLIVIGGVVGAVSAFAAKPVISAHITRELTSTLLLPVDKRFTVSEQSVKYNAGIGLLSFNVTVFGHKVIMSEQPEPDNFVDVPAVYQKVLEGMNDYSDFDVSVGTVHLTVPKQLDGNQAAVLDADGTLVFAKPTGSLSVDQWRQYFVTFAVVH